MLRYATSFAMFLAISVLLQIILEKFVGDAISIFVVLVLSMPLIVVSDDISKIIINRILKRKAP